MIHWKGKRNIFRALNLQKSGQPLMQHTKGRRSAVNRTGYIQGQASHFTALGLQSLGKLAPPLKVCPDRVSKCTLLKTSYLFGSSDTLANLDLAQKLVSDRSQLPRKPEKQPVSKTTFPDRPRALPNQLRKEGRTGQNSCDKGKKRWQSDRYKLWAGDFDLAAAAIKFCLFRACDSLTSLWKNNTL